MGSAGEIVAERQDRAPLQDGWTVDAPGNSAVGWDRMMTTGTQSAYSREVAWAREHSLRDIDFSTVYVFDAHGDDLNGVRAWLDAFQPGRVPFTVVIAPKRNDEITGSEYEVFQTAMDSLRAYPVSRPDSEDDLLAYVSGLLPVVPPGAPPFPLSGIPSEPDYSMFADHPQDTYEKTLTRLLRPIPVGDCAD